MNVGLTDAEREDLRRARDLLEAPGLAVRVADVLGRPIERGVAMLPERVLETVHAVVHRALDRGLSFALATMPTRTGAPSSDRLHTLASVTAGALGGFFGLAGLTIELPATTVIMLRSIGDIARSEGHDLSSARTRLDCLAVFALGGPSGSDDAAESGYWVVRASLARLIGDAVQHLAQKGAVSRGSPVLLKLIERIAVRFGLVVEEKVALEMLPILGAASGALINAVFMDHFQSTARGHFIIRRLEAVHGTQQVRDAFDSL